jgi:hypothetical protein
MSNRYEEGFEQYMFPRSCAGCVLEATIDAFSVPIAEIKRTTEPCVILIIG